MAMKEAALILAQDPQAHHKSVVILTDALSVLQGLKNPNNRELDDIVPALSHLATLTRTFVLQWIPAHCNIPGNERADRLAKEGGKMPQVEDDISYQEAKTMIRILHEEQLHGYCSIPTITSQTAFTGCQEGSRWLSLD